MNQDNSWTLILLGLIAFISVALVMPAYPQHPRKAKAAKLKSMLKQIGTAVAMYYTDDGSKNFPQSPALFEIDQSLINTDKTSSWNEINLNSPFYFFHNEEHEYTCKESVPLATNWEPIKIGEMDFYAIVFEDGHVESISREDRDKLINKSFKGTFTKFIYYITFQNNQAL